MKDYKLEIVQTRKGCLGSSDAEMIANIAKLGSVPKSKTVMERMAILKGFCEQKDITSNDAMRFGDYIEQTIFDMLSSVTGDYESNPLWVSSKYSRKNVKAISHPDIVRYDDDKKIIYVYEVKASKFTTIQVRNDYRHQLYWHSMFAKEIANVLGKEWKSKVFLAHYNTDGVDYANHDFDEQRLTIKEVRLAPNLFNINLGMDIIDDFLENFDSYYPADEIDADLLPVAIREKFVAVCDMLSKIKQMEIDIDSFKENVYQFMLAKNIKSIKNDTFSISRIDPSESVTFDFRRFLEDYSSQHPTLAKKLAKKYEKRSLRKGYASIKIKNNKNK